MEKAVEECFVDYITVSLISVKDGESEAHQLIFPKSVAWLSFDSDI